MTSKKVALYLFGYSCSGKSSVEALLREKWGGLYAVDYDVQKRQLSGYHRDKDRALVREVVLGLFEVVCKTGSPVLLTSLPLENEMEYFAYANIAERYGYAFYSFEFTAARNILISRYRERLEQYKNRAQEDSLKSESEFLETLDNAIYAPKNTVTFDTSDTLPEQIADQIFDLIDRADS